MGTRVGGVGHDGRPRRAEPVFSRRAQKAVHAFGAHGQAFYARASCSRIILCTQIVNKEPRTHGASVSAFLRGNTAPSYLFDLRLVHQKRTIYHKVRQTHQRRFPRTLPRHRSRTKFTRDHRFKKHFSIRQSRRTISERQTKH